jgi:alanine racemase
LRPAWAEVHLDRVRHNAQLLVRESAPSKVCAVVKADGYGHGSVEVARAALEGGATWLAVALAEEGTVLREAGITEPILLLSEPPVASWFEAVRIGLTPTVYTAEAIDALAEVAATAAEPINVHLKVDTGMHRVGAAPEDVVPLAQRIHAAEGLHLEGLWTHLAVADELGSDFTARQLERFEHAQKAVAAAGIIPDCVHASNSAGALFHPSGRFDMVRAGIALYGYDPAVSGKSELRPALELKARVTFVKRVSAGEAISYGLRYRFERASNVATIPIGYADGVPRRLGLVGGEILLRGKRRPIAGVVTMDQIMVDCADDDEIAVGDEVVLLGEQGEERITADDWARLVDTISYEILCDIGPRVPRVYVT